ncbi:TIGR02391 family protein [Mycolicibacterium cosmeticum]|uniref:TIGR02391 family protein n=1 Tax=Mycolicibacterium cosmeticum TaxID=258533 RepID=UPI003D161768
MSSPLLAEGVFAAFRNPAVHEPKLVWEVSEQDALDVLGTLDDPPPLGRGTDQRGALTPMPGDAQLVGASNMSGATAS